MSEIQTHPARLRTRREIYGMLAAVEAHLEELSEELDRLAVELDDGEEGPLEASDGRVQSLAVLLEDLRRVAEGEPR